MRNKPKLSKPLQKRTMHPLTAPRGNYRISNDILPENMRRHLIGLSMTCEKPTSTGLIIRGSMVTCIMHKGSISCSKENVCIAVKELSSPQCAREDNPAQSILQEVKKLKHPKVISLELEDGPSDELIIDDIEFFSISTRGTFLMNELERKTADQNDCMELVTSSTFRPLRESIAFEPMNLCMASYLHLIATLVLYLLRFMLKCLHCAHRSVPYLPPRETPKIWPKRCRNKEQTIEIVC